MDEMNNSDRLFAFERETRERGFHLIAGIDEAGRGPLAGPVVAAAVILPENCMLEGLNDSKKLTASQRERLFHLIHQKALSIGIGVVAHRIIDEINILEATKKAMLKAVSRLSRMPDFLLIDGRTPLDIPIKQATLVKGDSRCASIAAASIIAKVLRDRIMNGFDRIFPHYEFASHKGYATRAHINAIKNHGVCSIHRKTFKRVREYL
jgi:ribonuclease HII